MAGAPPAFYVGHASIGASGDRISPARSGQPFARPAWPQVGYAAAPAPARSRSRRRASRFFANISAYNWLKRTVDPSPDPGVEAGGLTLIPRTVAFSAD